MSVNSYRPSVRQCHSCLGVGWHHHVGSIDGHRYENLPDGLYLRRCETVLSAQAGRARKSLGGRRRLPEEAADPTYVILPLFDLVCTGLTCITYR